MTAASERVLGYVVLALVFYGIAVGLGGVGPHKMHLGTEESILFEPGESPLVLTVAGHRAGVAICADSSRPSHPEGYALSGAGIYAASVFLNAAWYAADAARLAAYAARHRMLTVMANHGASVGSHESVGRSAIWAPDGSPLVQAPGTEASLLIASGANDVWQGRIASL